MPDKPSASTRTWSRTARFAKETRSKSRKPSSATCAIIVALACLASPTRDSSAAEPVGAPPESPQVVAARSLGAWVVRLLPRPRRLLGLPPETRGALVDGVLAGGAAARAGIRKGDVIVAIDGAPVDGICALRTKLASRAPGTELALGIRRMSGAVIVPVTTTADAAAVAAVACEGGDALGCLLAGIVLQTSPERGPAAIRFFEKGCHEGHGDACSALGEAYLEGRGVPRDVARSAALFHRACENGSSSGCTSEAFQYATGTGVRRDDAWATPIFERGCDLGSASGCYNWGLMLEKGRGVETSLSRARAAYEQGCEGGDALACTNLGYLYDHALGVDPDDARAAELYARGCEGDGCAPGDPIACVNLAVFHRGGRGGLQEDERRVAELRRRACRLGHEPSCEP